MQYVGQVLKKQMFLEKFCYFQTCFSGRANSVEHIPACFAVDDENGSEKWTVRFVLL